MKKTMGKSRKVPGVDYVEDLEKYDKKQKKKSFKEMKTAGIANELKLSEKDQGYSKKPRVIPQKKTSAKGKTLKY